MGAETPLQSPFCFSYMRRGGNKQAKDSNTANTSTESSTTDTGTTATNSKHVPAQYENSIHTIATVSTVEEFWNIYDFLKRPNELPTTTDYHFFRDGIKPTWEDSNNAKGGKFIVRMPKGLASRYWEEIILCLIGDQFAGVVTGEICGAVLSVRYSEDILGIWNKTSSDQGVIDKIRDAIKKVLQLPGFVHMEYKPHQASLQDRSSFRNTHVWKPNTSSSESRRRNSSWTDRDKAKRSSDIRGSWRQSSTG